MSIRSALAQIINPTTPTAELPQTDKRNEVATSFFSSKRFLIIIAFGALLVLNMLPTALFHDVTLVTIAYLVCETITKTMTLFVNGWIKVREVNTDIDYEKLEDARRAKGVTVMSMTTSGSGSGTATIG